MQNLGNMAAANLVARSEAKLDARNAGPATLRWVIGVGFVTLVILMTLPRLFG